MQSTFWLLELCLKWQKSQGQLGTSAVLEKTRMQLCSFLTISLCSSWADFEWWSPSGRIKALWLQTSISLHHVTACAGGWCKPIDVDFGGISMDQRGLSWLASLKYHCSLLLLFTYLLTPYFCSMGLAVSWNKVFMIITETLEYSLVNRNNLELE